MNRSMRLGITVVFAVLLVGGPLWYWQFKKKRFRNFRVVTPGVLYRSGQLTKPGLQRVLFDYDIRTVVTFRDQDGTKENPSTWEEDFCTGQHVRHVRLPVKGWEADEGPAPIEPVVAKFMEVISDEEKYPRPILIHCYAGVHRAGAFTALYRIALEGWDPADAIDEMRCCGYDTIDKELDVKGYVLGYRPERKRSVAGGRDLSSF